MLCYTQTACLVHFCCLAMYTAAASFQGRGSGRDVAQYIGLTIDVWVGVSSMVLSNGKGKM